MSGGQDRPILICYDGSEHAKHAIVSAGALLLGSVSHSVVQHSKRPVLVIYDPPGPAGGLEDQSR